MAVIMVIDDEHDALTATQMLLSLEGHEVLTAHDAPTALAQIDDQPPDLVITDWMMPGMDGLELCRRLRDLEVTRDTPTIMVSGAHVPPPGAHGLFDRFLAKPVEISALLGTIRELL